MDLRETRRVMALTREVRELRSSLFKLRATNSRANLASQGNPLSKAYLRDTQTGSTYEVTVSSGTVTATKVR